MVRIEKMYFSLREVAKRWGVRKRDLAYMAENGELRTSVHLIDVHLERGLLEIEHGQELRILTDRSWFTGLLDLQVRDAVAALRCGEAEVVYFQTECNEYAALIAPSIYVTVKAKQLVIRRCERDRVEAGYGEAGNTVAEGIAFQHSHDFRNVRLGDLELMLGSMQAKVVQRLHETANAGAPWCAGKVVLADAGATSNRMSDVFKSQPRWRDLIASDGRGRYRLRLASR